MADEKVNVSPEEKKAPEAPAPSGPGEPPAPEHTEGPAVPGGAHAEPAAGEHTQQTVLPGMGEDAPAPSGKVINLSDIQAADKGGKEASAPAPDKKAPEADKPPKRRGRPPKEQAGPTVEKKSKAAEPRTGRPSKVDKAAREDAPPSVRDKVSRGSKWRPTKKLLTVPPWRAIGRLPQRNTRNDNGTSGRFVQRCSFHGKEGYG